MVDRMKLPTSLVLLGLTTLCACSGPSHVQMTPVPPPRYDRPAVPRDQPKTPPAEFSDEAADEFLKSEIERKTALEPKPAVVERVVYVREPTRQEREYEQEYRREHERYKSKFPWHTAAGAGLGAVIGHQSGRRDEGALIGAGVGFLMDLAR